MTACTRRIDSTTAKNSSRKRPRYLTSWEESFRRVTSPIREEHKIESPQLESPSTNHHRFGLVDLFGGNRWIRPKNSTKGTRTRRSKFFTLRMEHREGGTVARYAGEERFLLFRSDEAGAIAKVIFSSTPVKGSLDTWKTKTLNQGERQLESEGGEQREIITMANATVHVLFVKDAYRGFDLGGFLFALCREYLRKRYCHAFHSQQVSNRPLSSVRCRLNAEEDIRRHDKLVHFYEHLGFRKARKTKTTFIHNNNGETYRVVPMKMDLLLRPFENSIDIEYDAIASAYTSFLPAILNASCGEKARLSNQRIDTWLIVECQDGNIQLRTTNGKILQSNEMGQCQLIDSNNRPVQLQTFQLLRISDMLDKVLCDREEGYKEEQSRMKDKLLPQQKYYWMAKEKELWMIRSPLYGSFLGLTADHNLVFSKEPLFWQADENFCLTHTSDSPGRRQHHRRMWMKQSFGYATLMHERYSKFLLHRMTIEEALDLATELQANPFSMSTRWLNTSLSREAESASLPSFRTFLFHTAEMARKEGHPDWVQFVALVHGLASALTCLTKSLHGNDCIDDDEFDWTIYVDSRIMGCKASKQSTFAEFRHLNPDREDERYKTTNGLYSKHVGLEHVLLSWTSSDYMYYMLKHNQVRLPREAYAMLKLFPLVDWHSRGEHTLLSNQDDEELKDFIAEFYDLRQRSEDRIYSQGKILDDEECTHLWKNHYSLIAQKYGAAGILGW